MNFYNVNTQSEVIEGQKLTDMIAKEGDISISSSHGNPWSFNQSLLSSHMLALGSIGSGKTNLIYHIVKSIISNISERDIIIFFDSKGDFLNRFYRSNDYVIGNSNQYSNFPLSKWNLYRELSVTGSISREDTIREIATSLFRKSIDRAKDPTFASGGRDIFTALIEAQFRDNESNQNNASLRKFIGRLDVKGIKERIDRHPDLHWINIYMHSEGSATTQSFLSPLGSVVHDVFTAHFAEVGSFSIREAVQKRGGKSIFLEYDIVNSNLIDTVYTVLLDLASKEALGNAEHEGHVYFVLDEFPLIPKLNYIDNLINFGRSRGIRVIAGIQNINQVKSEYGESLGTSILSGFSTYMIFRLFDKESRDFVSDRHGRNRKLVRLPYSDASQSGNQAYEHGNVIEDWDMVALNNGECIVSLPSGNPCRFFPTLYPTTNKDIVIISNSPRIMIKRGRS